MTSLLKRWWLSAETPPRWRARGEAVDPSAPTSKPVAAFTVARAGLTVTFDASSSTDDGASLTGYAWTFSDGGSATGVVVTRSFASGGLKTATLTVTDGQNASSTTTQSFTVSTLTASFSSAVTNLSATFSATGSVSSNSTITSYAWDFGDGSTGTGINPTHVYAAAGSYAVKLTVTDAVGTTATYSLTIQPTPPPGVPTASFVVAVSNLTASFNATASSDVGSTITRYAWAFGDGSTGTGATVSHVYTAGTVTATLTVTDAGGGTASISKSITLTNAPANRAPIAAFVLSQPATNSVSVNASTSTDSDGSIASYAWAFGDGGTATGGTAGHTYQTAGTYTVALTVTDDDGASSSAMKSVSVTIPPVAPTFTLGTTKPVASNSGAGVLRAAPTGSAGTKTSTQTLSGTTVLKGWTVNGDVNMTGSSQLIDCIVHGRVKCTGSSGNPVVENCVVDGDGDYGASAGATGGDVWLLQSTMTGGYATFRFNTVKSRTVTYKLNGIGYKNFRSYRNNVSQVVDGSSVTASGASGVVMQGDYIHDLMFVRPDPNHSDWSHNDCCQVHGGTGTTWEGVNFEATLGPLKKGTDPYDPAVTGQAIGFTCDLSTAANGTVKNAWLSGGAHAFTAIQGNNTSNSLGTLTNVRFGRNSHVNTCQISTNYSYTASGLTYESNGAAVTVTRANS